jgi:hypothetical protein
MLNRTSHVFEGVGVYFDGKMAAMKGHLVSGGLASYGVVTLPIPAAAEVRWDDNGVHHVPKVKLEGRVPNNPIDWNIYFIIEKDGTVTVASVSSDDRAGNQQLQKGLRELRAQE